jgi:hypothetical protein
MTSRIPANYNPIDLFHWLWWRIRCLEASPSEFQHLFEKVAGRIRPDFMKVRPYGNLGDRKCDGLYWGDGVIFQVYSPDELRQAETVAKIKEDLAGAASHWAGQIKKWVFVYNTRLGLAPDIPRILGEQKERYPDITIEPLSSETIWDLTVTTLNLQQRAELLGAPPGYENMFLMPGAVPSEVESLLQGGRFVLVQDVMSPINIQDAIKSLKPDKPFGAPFFIRPPSVTDSWELAVQYQQKLVEEALAKSQHLLPKFAVFSLAPIPLAIHLGYLLSDRVEVRPFQYDRDRKTWCWDESKMDYDVNFRVEGLPEQWISEAIDVTVRVSLSARIGPRDSVAAAGDLPVQIDLFVEEPDVMWLCHPEQLVSLGKAFRNVLREVNRRIPRCQTLHLFYAGPTGGALTIGQAINPRMTQRVTVYDYNRQNEPKYRLAMTLC